MAFVLGPKSRERLTGVEPELAAVVKRAIELTTQDFMVLEGVRTVARQKQLYAQGRTAPGNIVTWTMRSKHIEGKAVDLVPWPVDWNTASKFDAIYTAMMAAADELGVSIRSGMDWDGDGKLRERRESDSPHFEIVGP